MKAIVLSISSTEERDLPEGKTFGGFRFRLTAPGGGTAESAVTTELSFAFNDPAPGKYAATLFVLDADGADIVPALETEVEVTADPPPPPAAVYPHPLGFQAAVVEL